MKFKFVNVPTNYKGQEKEQLVAGEAEFAKTWRILTGKRNATEDQVIALENIIAEAKKGNNDIVDIVH